MLDLLQGPPFEDFGRWGNLEALARTYLGDEHRAMGELDLAAQQLSIAGRELRRGIGDLELRATWLELKAELAQARGQYTLALGLLDEALELLRRNEIEGRQAETLILRGLAHLRSGDDPGARKDFQHALSNIPPGKTLRMRLRALQYLALAEVRSRRFVDAQHHLAAASELRAHSTKLLEAQRLWTEGILHLETRNYGAAEEPLHRSLERFRMLGRTLDAAQVLTSLGRLYMATDRWPEFVGLERKFRPLLEVPATLKWVLALRERVVRWAKQGRISLPSNAELLAELGEDRKKWVH